MIYKIYNWNLIKRNFCTIGDSKYFIVNLTKNASKLSI